MDILLYGIIGDEWDGLDAKTLVPMISDSTEDLDVRINSPGGFIVEGLAIYNALGRAQSAGRKVTVHIDGLAASMAGVIAMVGEERLMADNALMMIHNPWDIAMGDAAELRRAADKLDKMRDQLVKIYGSRTGLAADDLKVMLDAETWLTAKQALDQKFVTKLVAPLEAAACDVSSFGFHKAPESPHLVTSMAAAIRSASTGGAVKGVSRAVAAIIQPKEKTMPPKVDPAAPDPADPKTAPQALTDADVQARADDAVKAERLRIAEVRALAKKHGLDDDFAAALERDGTTVADARAKVLDKLAERGDSANIGLSGPIVVGKDEREKFVEGAANWVMIRAGVADRVKAAAKLKGETIDIDAGNFRGATMVDLARESLRMSGARAASFDPREVVGAAFTAKNAVTQGTGDFGTLLENALHKTLQAAYAVTPDTWSRFCGIGVITDFRPHMRYLRGSFGVLDTVNELGEFKNKPIPDGAKESITGKTVGNIISLSRQAIINDDLSAFTDLATDIGRAAKLTIEIDVYAVLNANPNMNDGVAMFHATHGNLRATGAAPSVAEFDAMRVGMKSQKDISGNDYLEIAPAVLVLPIALGGPARVVNGSEYDPDTANKLQRKNIALGMFQDIVDTPRLTGTAYYAFADPNLAPAIEVDFLNGEREPYVDSQDGWRVDGTEWKVRHDYGVGPVNYRSAYKNNGA